MKVLVIFSIQGQGLCYSSRLNARGITMDCSCLYSPRVVLGPWLMPGGLPWTVVVSTRQGWCYGSRLMPGALPWIVVVSTDQGL